MNQWSRTRKRIILGILILFVVVIVGVPAFLIFYNTPTCFDGKQNGGEAGIDCGGACQLLCSSESVPLLIKGDPRILSISENTFQVVAVVENSNASAEIYRARYTLKVYDGVNSIPVKVFEGETYVPKGDTFAIFEGPFTLEEGITPRKATLEWDDQSIVWEKNDRPSPDLEVGEKVFSRLESNPRLEAVVENRSLEKVSNVDLVALVSDAEGNIFAASKTFIDTLLPGEESKVVFTWPKPFEKEPVGTEVIVRVFPDRSFIR